MVDHVNGEPKFELIGSDGLFNVLRHLRYGTGHDDPMPLHPDADAAVRGARNQKGTSGLVPKGSEIRGAKR